MQLTRYTDYSLRVLMYLALKDSSRLCTVSEIADHFIISRNHLIKIVHHLGKLGYLITVRGKGGGIKLAMDASNVSIGEVIRNVEAVLDPVNCDNIECPIQGYCQLVDLLCDARDAFLNHLDQYSINDVLSNRETLVQVLKMLDTDMS